MRLSVEQRQRTLDYWTLLVKWNRRINLTAVRDFEAALQLHFFESFWAADQFLVGYERLADIGSGAGFPGLAALIRQPQLGMVLIEPNLKKASFLEQASHQLCLEVQVFCGRGEEFGDWDSIDAACLRGLRAEPPLSRRLREADVDLIAFHGPEADLSALGEPARCLKIPASRRRMVSLIRNVSRETPFAFTPSGAPQD